MFLRKRNKFVHQILLKALTRALNNAKQLTLEFSEIGAIRTDFKFF